MPKLADLAIIRALLDQHGLILVTDKTLPDVAHTLAGGPIRGSWWGHEAGTRIFDCLTALTHDEEVLGVPLISGKVTLVHARLWPALVAVGSERAQWQVKGLSSESLALLSVVQNAGPVRSDQADPKPSRATVKALSRALLVHSEQVHTESGAHAIQLMDWGTWAKGRGLPIVSANEGRTALEGALVSLKSLGGQGKLPW
jgi:hypothetical protein